MSKFFEKINNSYYGIKIDKDDFLERVAKSYSSKEKLIIKNTSELEYLWNTFPYSIDLRKNFVYPFDNRTKGVSKIDYEKDVKDLCADLLLSHFIGSIEKTDCEAEIILKKYFEIEIDYLMEVKKLVKKRSKNDVIEKWIQYGLYYSKDPNFFKYSIDKVKKTSGYTDKKYKIAKSAIENESLSMELNKSIIKSVTAKRAADLCWAIKYNVDKRLNSRDSKHFFNLKHKYKKSYEKNFAISDEECNLCVLLALKGGEKVCDIVSAFLPEKYCVFIFPLCTNQISINNLKRRSIL